MTGGEAVGFADVAAALSERDWRDGDVSADLHGRSPRPNARARSSRHELIDATLALAAYQKAGGPTAKVSDSVERILGRPPRTDS